MSFVNEKEPGLRRTIDYGRNAILKCTKAHGIENGCISDFQILWNDAKIEFSALLTETYKKKPIPDILQWKIISYIIPDYLQQRKLEIIDLIKEALIAYGNLGDPNWQGTSIVTVDAALGLEN